MSSREYATLAGLSATAITVVLAGIALLMSAGTQDQVRGRPYLGNAMALVPVAYLLWASSASPEPLDVGTRKQLFVGPWAEDGRDDYLVESMQNVTMAMNEAQVIGEPLLVPDKPWEHPGVHQSVLRDGDILRMYYTSRDLEAEQREKREERPVLNQWLVLYAESTDGVHWEKPNLGVCDWEGSRENNILFPNDDFPYVFLRACVDDVFLDPNAQSADERYKMSLVYVPPEEDAAAEMQTLPKGHYPFCSPDGIHWKLMSTERVNTGAHDAQYSFMWDDQIGKYVQYSRIKPRDEAQSAYYERMYGSKAYVNVRMIGRATSDDFINWTEGTIVLRPDEIDKANSPSEITRLDFYYPQICKYSEAPSAYIALPNCHSHWKFVRGSERRLGFPETLDVQLATSRDGIQWNRAPGRRPFIRLGPEGTFWSKMIYPGTDIIRVGDELWVYFGGMDVSHNLETSGQCARGRAVLRLDGFISADAAYTGGELTTRPLIFSGTKLQLNLATGAGGTVQVEIQDEAGKPIEGFALADADEMNGNYLRVLASWQAGPIEGNSAMRLQKGDTDVSRLAGQAVRLRFVMRDAKLYSFQFLP